MTVRRQSEASEVTETLGLSHSAVRKRIKRETIPWDIYAEGRTYVYLDPSETFSGIGEDRSRDASLGLS